MRTCDQQVGKRMDPRGLRLNDALPEGHVFCMPILPDTQQIIPVQGLSIRALKQLEDLGDSETERSSQLGKYSVYSSSSQILQLLT